MPMFASVPSRIPLASAGCSVTLIPISCQVLRRDRTLGGPAVGMDRGHAKAHVFNMTGLVEAYHALRAAFHLVF